jgi:AcrR family transcriptional regulator
MARQRVPVDDGERSTKQRLVAEGMRLFAEGGFRATTVGDIEAAAGLARRAGGLYKHFPSKRALLEAGIQRHIQEVSTAAGVIDLLPLRDLRSELTLVARWLLAELAKEREVALVLEKEGDGSLAELRERFAHEVIERGYRQGAELVARLLKHASSPAWDHEAVAVMAIGALVNYRRTQWTYGLTPLDIDEERLVHTFVELLAEGAGRVRGEGDA